MSDKGLYALLPLDDILKDWRTHCYERGWFIFESGVLHIWSNQDSVFVPKGLSKHVDWTWYIVNARKPDIYDVSRPHSPIKTYARVQLIHGLPRPTSEQIRDAWLSFKPTVPLSYVLVARKAARNR